MRLSFLQEVQRNGKAGLPAGRWPSLLSLTCPRSSGSGSELSLSSAGSEYSSGSHTWADGRGVSKQVCVCVFCCFETLQMKIIPRSHSVQCSAGRDKRMSTGSVSSHHSVEQTDLGWKEGHILKGLKRLQTKKSKEASSHASVSHCKDCMISNEGIYSLGVKSNQQGAAPKKVASPTSNTGMGTVESDDPDDEKSKSVSRESSGEPTRDHLCLDKLDLSKVGKENFQGDSVSLSADSGLFPSPDSESVLFLDCSALRPGVSPTDSLTRLEKTEKNSLEDHKSPAINLSDRNNNQERSTDRKSRLDYNKKEEEGFPVKPTEVTSSLQHSATRALSCMNEARQRSSSMEVPHCKDQTKGSKDQVITESPQRRPKPQFCDSARRAFILRSKSADGGQEQLKHVHSPLHQKLIKGQRPKVQSEPNPSGHSVQGKRSNLNNANGSSKSTSTKTEQNEDLTAATSSKSLENVQQPSPVVSPVQQSKIIKSPGLKSPTKSSLQVTQVSSSDSVEESVYDNLPCSPQKQRRQDHQGDAAQPEHRSPSPPGPPGRSTSLLLRSSSENSAKDQKPGVKTQSSTTGKPGSTKTESNVMRDQHPGLQTGYELIKDVPAKIYHTSVSNVPIQESQSAEFTDRNKMSCEENGAPFILSSQRILQRSQQSVSEPKLSEVLPAGFPNVSYQEISFNHQTSSSNIVKRTLPVNAKSHEVITGKDTSTIVIFGRQNKDDVRNLQTFQTFSCDPQAIHDRARRKIETRCSSLDSEPVQPVTLDDGGMLDWGLDEQGWLFKRSVSVSTRPLLKPVMGMNGAKARSQSFGARYMDRPSFNRSGKVRTQIKTHSGSSLNSLGDVLPGSMSCSSSYHCPMNRSLLNNFLIEEGLTVPSQLGSSSERLQSLKLQREQARRLQIEQQFSSAFGEPVSEEPERQSTITTIEEKVMLGIEENLHKSQEQERTNEVKQKSSSGLASWFGFRKSKLPAMSGRKADPPKVKEEKREQKITSLLGGKNTKSDKKKERRKSDGKDW